MIRFRCIKCNKSIKVESRHAGRKATCSGCGNKIRVPSEVGSPGRDSVTSENSPASTPPPRENREPVPKKTKPRIEAAAKTAWFPLWATILVTTLVAGTIGYFAGREHVKYQMVEGFRKAFSGIGDLGSSEIASANESNDSATPQAVKMGTVVRRGIVEISVGSAIVDKPKFLDFGSSEKSAAEDHLLIDLKVRNSDDRKVVRFSDNSYLTKFELVDDVGNKIRRVKPSVQRIVGAMTSQTDLNPGDSAKHREVFSIPLPKTKYIVLSVDMSVFGQEGNAAFKIPASEWKAR